MIKKGQTGSKCTLGEYEKDKKVKQLLAVINEYKEQNKNNK